MALEFIWDPEKAASNLEKHGVRFEDASTAFGDSLSITIPDPAHSESEHRYVLMGRSIGGQLLVVVHSERKGSIRIISAREATRRERRDYEQG